MNDAGCSGGGCDEVIAELERFIDGECSEDLETSIRRHLADCEHCLDRADFERHIRELIASRCREQAPPGLIEKVLGRLDASPRP